MGLLKMPVDCSKAMNNYNEIALKAEFLRRLVRSRTIDANSIISSEYFIDGAARRADLAILSNSRLVGVEVKSEFDTLRRLDGQLKSYIGIFDEVLLLVAARHLDAALEIAPLSVGIYSATDRGRITRIRKPSKSDLIDNDREALLRALPKAKLLPLIGKPAGRMARRDIIDAASEIPTTALRSTFVATFANRYGPTSRAFWRQVENKTITVDDLALLSLFAEQRKSAEHARLERERMWERWAERRRPDEGLQAA